MNLYPEKQYGVNAEKLARDEGGTSAWPQIMSNIRVTKPTNIILCTDSDMDTQASRLATSYYAPGCV